MATTIDGVQVPSRPITWARLYCGCTKFYDGHDIPVDRVALCPEPQECDGHQHGLIRQPHSVIIGGGVITKTATA